MKMPIAIHVCPPGGYRYTQEETGVRFKSQGISALYGKVYVHRLANPDLGLDIASDWQERFHEELCEQMPDLPCKEVERPENHPTVIEGRKRWGELHEYAGSYPEEPTSEDVEKAKVWMEEWRSKIPAFGCRCKSKFKLIEAENPLRLDSRNSFYRWTVEVHDAVSKKLGKPTWAEIQSSSL